MKTLFCNGYIKTMDAARPEAGAVLVDGERIIAVGTRDELLTLGPADRTVDLQGRVLLPGFVDTHTHFFQVARRAIDIDLTPARNLDEVCDLLQAYKERMPELPPWIGGCGWDRNIFPSTEGFDRTLLDRYFPDTPVMLKNKDLHTKWVNTKALQMAGIDRNTPNPPDGTIERDEHGDPNGFLHERAWKLMQKITVLPAVPMQKQMIRDAVAWCHTMGLIGAHLMESEVAHELYPQLQSEGMKFRVYWHFSQSQLDSIIAQGVHSYSGDEWFKTCGMKLFMDGSIGSQTAYMREPYPHSTDRGMLTLPPEQLYRLMTRAAQHGLACSVHAIGDETVHLLIETIDRVNRECGWQPHRIEHLQCLRPEDYPKLVANRIRAAVQPVHIKADVELLHQYWPNVEKYTYSFRNLLDAGVLLGYGSDAPVETIDPGAGIYAALERRYRNDPQNPSWRPEQKLTLDEALRGYTIDAARIANSEADCGSITPGKYADLIVLDDFRNQPHEFWLTAQSRFTMVAGEVVYAPEEA